MSNKPPVRNVLWQAVALLALAFSTLMILFVMFLGFLGHDESREREDLRKAMQELQQTREK